MLIAALLLTVISAMTYVSELLIPEFADNVDWPTAAVTTIQKNRRV
jgi:hypothetical protein